MTATEKTAAIPSLGVRYVDLQDGQCRFPLGRRFDRPDLFCGCYPRPSPSSASSTISPIFRAVLRSGIAFPGALIVVRCARKVRVPAFEAGARMPQRLNPRRQLADRNGHIGAENCFAHLWPSRGACPFRGRPSEPCRWMPSVEVKAWPRSICMATDIAERPR
jgi:hypothetical protein